MVSLWMISCTRLLQLFVKLQNGFLVCSHTRFRSWGIVLHHGDVPEMRTGEGKTLTATMPVYLNALSGKGARCHRQWILDRAGCNRDGRTILMAWPFSRDQPCSKNLQLEKKKLTSVISLTQPTQRSGLTTCVTTWLCVLKTWFNVHWTMPWSMR